MMTQGNDDELHEIIASNCDKDRVMWVRVKEGGTKLIICVLQDTGGHINGCK